jgi:hypothetical protein
VLESDLEALFGIISAGDEPLRQSLGLSPANPLPNGTILPFSSNHSLRRQTGLFASCRPLLPFCRSSLGQKTVFRADQLPSHQIRGFCSFPTRIDQVLLLIEERRRCGANRQIDTSASPVNSIPGCGCICRNNDFLLIRKQTPLATHSPHPTQTCDNIKLTNN